MTVSDGYAEYEVTESDFTEACNRASYWAKRRILRKMQKVVYRKATYDAKAKGVVLQDMPPSNVEEAVKQFVWCNREKA